MSDDMCIYKLIKYAVSNGVISPNNARSIVKGLITRDQALKRCRELKNFGNMDHLSSIGYDTAGAATAIIDELVYVFDINEEEL